MKRKLLPFFTVLALLLTSCGAASAVSPSPVETSPQTFGEEIHDVMSSAAVVEPSLSDDAGVLSDSTFLEENEGTESVDFLPLAIKSLACCIYLDGMNYSSNDPVFFWRAVGYFISLTGSYVEIAEDDGDTFLVQASDLPVFVEALFGPYPDQYPSLGEENPFVASEFSESGETYRVTKWDLSSYAVTYSELEMQDGVFRTEAVFSERGEDVAVYDVALSETAEEPFPLSVIGFSAE